jgi:hypothetical protein
MSFIVFPVYLCYGSEILHRGPVSEEGETMTAEPDAQAQCNRLERSGLEPECKALRGLVTFGPGVLMGRCMLENHKQYQPTDVVSRESDVRHICCHQPTTKNLVNKGEYLDRTLNSPLDCPKL